MALFNLIKSKPKRELSNDFTQIVEDNQRNIYMLVLRIVGTEMDAEDITQEVFIKFYKSHTNFRGDSKVSTLLYRIAYNHAIDFVRKKKKSVTVELDESVHNGEEQDLSYHEKIEILDRAIESLDIEERTIITLFYKDGKSIEEISKIATLSIANIKVKLHRIRKKLHKYIGESYYE